MTPEDKVPETPAHEGDDPDDQAAANTTSDMPTDEVQGSPQQGAAQSGCETVVDPRVDDVLGEGAEQASAEDQVSAPDSDDSVEAPDSLEALKEKLAAAEARADENYDRMLRMQADVENKNKRAQRDVQNARKFALEAIANELLPIRDSLEMGLAAAREEAASVDSIREGSELTLNMLSSAMEKHQICELNPVGEKFDPEFHQAMSMLPVEDGTEPNTVIHVMQKGYTLNERLIRPALVTVAK